MLKVSKYLYLYSFVFILFIIVNLQRCFAQRVALGTWTAHVPLNSATSVCQSKDYVYAACKNGIIGVNIDNGLIEKYTKVNGLADVFTERVGYDTISSTLVIAYKNSDVDLIQHGKIINLPYLKNAAIAGDKKVYDIFCFNGKAYIALGYGVMVIDLINQEIEETYSFIDGATTIRVNSIYADESQIICGTSLGVLKGKIAPNINLLSYSNWTKYSIGIPQNNATAITKFENKLLAAIDNSIYQFDGTNWSLFYTTDVNWKTMHLNNSNAQLLIAQQKISGTNIMDGRIGKWNGSDFIFNTSQFNITYPMQIIEDKNNKTWHADEGRGLIQQTSSTYNSISPNSPFVITSKEMDFLNGAIWASSSAIRNGWNPDNLSESKSFSACRNYTWENYTKYNYSFLDTFNQIAVVKALPTENKIFFGAADFSQGGIIEFNPTDNSFIINKRAPNVRESFRITGADVDINGNVWFSNAYSNAPIICRKKDGNYIYFNNGFLNSKLVKDVVVDDNNQVWIAKEVNDGGIVVLNYGNDIDDKSDDQYFNLAAGKGFGNLPINNVICMAKDKDGVIWLGTAKGIAIVSCSNYITDYSCEAEQICIDRNDGSGFCDNLLEDEIINCITIDAANRKWIGTNNGLFLVSADGFKTIHYFNENNSPLLANYIRGISINPENGDVFISTDKGICSYRADATDSDIDNEKPFVYPNPVTNDYKGLISFKGIPNNSTVKIIDISGNLVYQTVALGGNATWDGNLTNGERAATGVYIALCTAPTGKDKAKLKFVLIH